METKNREAALINLLVKAVIAKDSRSRDQWISDFRQEILTPENIELVQLLLEEKDVSAKGISDQARLRYETLMATRRRPVLGRVRRLPLRSGRASRK